MPSISSSTVYNLFNKIKESQKEITLCQSMHLIFACSPLAIKQAATTDLKSREAGKQILGNWSHHDARTLTSGQLAEQLVQH